MPNDPIRGHVIRWQYDDGPTKGQQFEHTFYDDGTCAYRMATDETKPDAMTEVGERPTYEVADAGNDVWLVTYLAPSGWALTTTLDMRTKRIVSVASNEKQLFVQRGTFEDRGRR